MKKILVVLLSVIILIVTYGCDKTKYGQWNYINVHLNEISLNWEEGFFIHNDNKILISESEIKDKNDLDKHDLTYQYAIRENELENGDKVIERKFVDLDHENPVEEKNHITISTKNLDVMSKIKNKDEIIDDYYFYYDFHNIYTNNAYFKISKDDINKLVSNDYNEIQFDVIILKHIDETKSFKINTKDDMADVCYYSNVHIYNNN